MPRASAAAVPALFLTVALFLSGLDSFRICSYNIPHFNKTKSSNYKVIHTLTKIFARCDVSLLLDVQDPNAVTTLLAALNRYSDRYTDQFKYESVSSKALGTDPKDMQYYTFIYRIQLVSVTGQHQSQSPTFVRPPFCLRFHSNWTLDPEEFVLVPLHSEQSQAVQEMNGLYDVFLEVTEKWNNTNVMFLGDFHAGCAFMTRGDKKNIRLFSNTSFSWLISDRTDTTVTDKTHCPYDRIVVYKTFLKKIKPLSAKVFNPIKAFKIRSSKLVEVSDHFPLEVELKSSVTSLLKAPPLYYLLLSLRFLFLL